MPMFQSEILDKHPIGTILPWLKTYHEKATGTNTSVSTNRLIDSSGSFVSSGIQKDMIVYNETDGTFAHGFCN